MARDTESGECPHCNGWGFEPDHYPMKDCTACGGTGRKTGAQTGRLAGGD